MLPPGASVVQLQHPGQAGITVGVEQAAVQQGRHADDQVHHLHGQRQQKCGQQRPHVSATVSGSVCGGATQPGISAAGTGLEYR